MKFNSTFGAALVGLLALVYGVAALATSHSAVSEPPPDLSANDKALDVWKTTALLVKEPVAVVDVRPAERFALYHLPGAVNLPAASPEAVLQASAGKVGLVVAETDKEASSLVGTALAQQKDARLHFLKEGVRAWYLALEVPVPLFSDKPAPLGYEAALGTVKAYLAKPDASAREATLEAVGTLAKAAYEPSQLAGKKKAAAGGGKKKISGGCGG